MNDRRRNQQTGEWDDYANFIDCTVFAKRAEALHGLLSKGQHVAIEGKLRWSQWEGQDGQKRSKVSVIVDEIEWDSRRDNGTAGPGGVDEARQADAPGLGEFPMPDFEIVSDIYDEDIPF